MQKVGVLLIMSEAAAKQRSLAVLSKAEQGARCNTEKALEQCKKKSPSVLASVFLLYAHCWPVKGIYMKPQPGWKGARSREVT